MAKYTNGQSVVDAIQFNPKSMNRKMTKDALGDDPIIISSTGYYVEVSGQMKMLNSKDYVVKDENGKFYSCKQQAFEREYELVE